MVYFFEKQNPNELSNKMITIMNASHESPSINELFLQREENVKLGAEYPLSIFNEVV